MQVPSNVFTDRNEHIYVSPTLGIPPYTTSDTMTRKGNFIVEENPAKSEASPLMYRDGMPTWMLLSKDKLGINNTAQVSFTVQFPDAQTFEAIKKNILLPSLITDLVFHSKDNSVTFMCDPHAPWRFPLLWHTTQFPYFAAWTEAEAYIGPDDVDMWCIGPTRNHKDWTREVVAVPAGSSMVITRETEGECYLIPLYGEFYLNGEPLPDKRISRLRSKSTTLSTTSDSMLCRVRRNDR